MNPFIIYLMSAKLVLNPIQINTSFNKDIISLTNFKHDSTNSNLVYGDSDLEKEISHNGLKLEQDYQKELRKTEKTRKGTNLIVLCDDGKGTGLYLGNTKLAAETIKENLNGRTIIKEFYNDSIFFDYLLNSNELKADEKIKNIFWFGQGYFNSLWMELTFKDEKSYLDESDFDDLSETDLTKIKKRFTSDAEMKIYTSHASANNWGDTPIAETLSTKLDINVTGANSWVFTKEIKKNGKTKVYFYPATRKDYEVEFNTKIPDPLYNGKSRWVQFKK
ncbi:MAG: hypothetical protein ISS82_05655 [Nanoarchaeota archaeon]|nr:hypothetical protein [Nanoarchaeota archaeon]